MGIGHSKKKVEEINIENVEKEIIEDLQKEVDPKNVEIIENQENTKIEPNPIEKVETLNINPIINVTPENIITEKNPPITQNDTNREQKPVISETPKIILKPPEKEKEIIIQFSKQESIRFITRFYEDFIDIISAFLVRKSFTKAVRNFNEHFLFNFNAKKFSDNQTNREFLKSFKYSSIVTVCFIFLSKDSSLYKSTSKKIKDYVDQFVYSCLDSTDRTIIFSLRIVNYYQRYRKNKRSLYGCTNGIIKDVFKNRQSYRPILNCLDQLMKNINNESTQNIVSKVNETILFFYNHSYYSLNNINIVNNNDIKDNKTKKENKKESKRIIPNKKREEIEKKVVDINKNKSKQDTIEDNGDGGGVVDPPFIKNKMEKKFCLVLDIDETLSHTIKLPFGNYFLVRPGALALIKDLSYYYEVDIFTAALKHYADNILNKLDRNNNYISYRLYRCHCTYEDGKSVKKLGLIGRDLSKVIFVDDIRRNAKYNPQNLFLVSKWIDNIYDDELFKLKEKLEVIAISGQFDDDITKGLGETNSNKGNGNINNGNNKNNNNKNNN